MKKLFILLFIGGFIVLLGCSREKTPYDYVDPFIGTGGHGHTFPGATMPFGMVQLSPDTRKDSWDGCSGYHYSDNTIMGFSHTHLSGTGVGDYGDIRFMPTTGVLKLDPGTAEDPQSGYRSRFSHRDEDASPGYYSVELEDYDIDVELTATKRCSFHKYIFPKTNSAHVIIDLVEGITSDKIEFLEIQVLDDQTFTGIRKTDGWADDQRIYFHAVFSKPFYDYGITKGNNIFKSLEKVYSDNIKAFFNFKTEKNEELLIKVGISAVSVEGARKNLMAEIPGWNFSKIRKNARRTWEEQLNKIEVVGSRKDRTIFYTALYHCFIAPNLFTDVDGRYRGHDGEHHKAEGFNMYTVFSLWDTFRAEHPLLTLIERERTKNFIKSMYDIYEKGGLLPVWELAGNETNCMIGYHSVPVITDAYIKGIRDFVVRETYDAMRRSAIDNQFGLKWYKKYGYIPSDKEGESVSKTLEYAYDDWCIAQMARELGRENEYEKYIERAQYYKNLFDKETGFIRGKRNGMFTEPFDPSEVNFMLTEANTWQYNFFVPQDINGFIGLYDGPENFTKKLDEMFSAKEYLSGRHQVDITGLIGQYAHGNEPSHHMAYLYDYAGEPWKAQHYVHRIIEEHYSDKPDGLSGNEDCGQMSAWYVLSSLGFYPVTPGDTIYAIGTPVFQEAVINLENGNEFIIKATNVSPGNYYIQSARLNGEEYNKCYISHQDIMKGGELVFDMGSQPNKKWGTGAGNMPVSLIDEHLITPVPFFDAPSHAFTKQMQIEIKDILDDVKIYYTLDGQEPDRNSHLYKKPFTIDKTTVIKAFAKKKNMKRSKTVEAEFIKIPGNREVYLNTEYSTQYTGGGKIALIDGLRGGKNFRAAGWQGYQGSDLDAIIDLGKVQKVNKIAVGFLQDQRSWIFMPPALDFYISEDGKNYRHIGKLENSISPEYKGVIIDDYVLDDINRRARYVKVKAKNIGKNPEWHNSPGKKSWLFVDEVIVE